MHFRWCRTLIGKAPLLGQVFLFAYVALASIQEVYFSHLFQKSDPIAVLGLLILVTFLFAAVREFVSGGWRAPWKLRQLRSDLAILNLSSILSWLGFFLSLRYIEPAIASIICFMLGPSVLVLFSRQTVQLVDRLLALGLVVVTGLLFLVSLKGLSSSQAFEVSGVVYGFAWGAVSAIGIVLNTIYSKALSNGGYSENRIMLVRFIALLVLAFAVAPHGGVAQAVENSGPLALIGLGLVTFYLPVWILQLAISRLAPIVISFGLSVIPAVTYFLQLADSRFYFSIFTFVLIATGTVFSLIGAMRKERRRA